MNINKEIALKKVSGLKPKEFADKAFDGGWGSQFETHCNCPWREHCTEELEYYGDSEAFVLSSSCYSEHCDQLLVNEPTFTLSEMLLDKEAWKAVGKTEKWENLFGESVHMTGFLGGIGNVYGVEFDGEAYLYKMHQLINEL